MNPKLQIGNLFEGKYQLEELLGRGGLGIVFRAKQIEFSRTVALKIILHSRITDEDAKKRFLREAKVMSQLSHVNLPTIYHFGISADDEPYLVMELIDGRTIRSEIEKNGKLSIVRALKFTRDIASALDYVHTKDIVHRDLKTSNFLLAKETVKVIDFGLAKDAQLDKVTMTGEIIGTPEYMSPEQCVGRPITAKSDIYSLGICLFEMLIGQSPFRSESNIESIRMHLAQPVPAVIQQDNPSLAERLNKTIQKATAKNVDERYSTMHEFANDLSSCLELLETSKKELYASLPQKSAIRERVKTAYIAGFAILVIAGAFLFVRMTSSETLDEMLHNPPAAARVKLYTRLEQELNKGENDNALFDAQTIFKSDAFSSWSTKDELSFITDLLELWKKVTPSNEVEMSLAAFQYLCQRQSKVADPLIDKSLESSSNQLVEQLKLGMEKDPKRYLPLAVSTFEAFGASKYLQKPDDKNELASKFKDRFDELSTILRLQALSATEQRRICKTLIQQSGTNGFDVARIVNRFNTYVLRAESNLKLMSNPSADTLEDKFIVRDLWGAGDLVLEACQKQARPPSEKELAELKMVADELVEICEPHHVMKGLFYGHLFSARYWFYKKDDAKAKSELKACVASTLPDMAEDHEYKCLTDLIMEMWDSDLAHGRHGYFDFYRKTILKAKQGFLAFKDTLVRTDYLVRIDQWLSSHPPQKL